MQDSVILIPFFFFFSFSAFRFVIVSWR